MNAAARATRTPTPTTEGEDRSARYRSLRRYNLVAALFHALQVAAVLALANDFASPVTGTYLVGPPGSPGETVPILDVPVGLAVAGFLALSAIFHVVVASPPFFDRYVAGLEQKINVFRWVEYSLSSSLMIVLIALITGISDVAALLAIFGVNASMILFGWLQEKYHQPGDGGWLPFVFGCIAGVVPWLAVLVYVLAPGSTSGAEPPTFVYAIIISLFAFFNVFALNQWLQYRQVGRFRDYLVGERAYVTLSLVAKSALAWQVFAGTLAP
ncbi:MAG TPA: heliorhodopsin HeR [Actinotalea sp.]|nr:heliorhodopsin HeR [Actinotalea sp.]